ncbi:hypothetical protein D7V91_02455 [bacterium 1xD42-67]|nr:hypothetical protein D7V91_02455 [bacterium 1xD42-67]
MEPGLWDVVESALPSWPQAGPGERFLTWERCSVPLQILTKARLVPQGSSETASFLQTTKNHFGYIDFFALKFYNEGSPEGGELLP